MIDYHLNSHPLPLSIFGGKRSRQGFTLIEFALVLSFVGVLIAGIWMAVSTVTFNQKQAQLIKDVQYTITRMQTLYNGKPNLGTITPARSIAMGMVPKYLIDPGGQTAHNIFDKRVVGSGTMETGSGLIGQFNIKLYGIPKTACINLLTTLFPNPEAVKNAKLVFAAYMGNNFLQTGFSPSNTNGCNIKDSEGNVLVIWLEFKF